MVGPGDEISAAGAGDHSPLRASHADREQVIDALKAAFVDGRLARDEFDLRVGQVLAAYADLDALTADIPAPARLTAARLTAARLTAAPPSAPAREPDNKKLIARGTAAGAGATMVFVVALGVAAGHPALGLFLGTFAGAFVAVLLAGFLALLSWVLGKGADRQPSQGQGPGASGQAGPRLASPGSAGPPPQIGHDPRHTAEAARSRRPRPAMPSVRLPHRRRPLAHRYAIGYPGH
jgi:hypothetical protein